jgi:hypothetical protein
MHIWVSTFSTSSSVGSAWLLLLRLPLMPLPLPVLQLLLLLLLVLALLAFLLLMLLLLLLLPLLVVTIEALSCVAWAMMSSKSSAGGPLSSLILPGIPFTPFELQGGKKRKCHESQAVQIDLQSKCQRQYGQEESARQELTLKKKELQKRNKGSQKMKYTSTY